MDDIQETVGARFHVKIADLKSRRRSKTLVHPRQIAMYLCRELTDCSFPEIGRQFGGQRPHDDHARLPADRENQRGRQRLERNAGRLEGKDSAELSGGSREGATMKVRIGTR